jgi:glycosidase
MGRNEDVRALSREARAKGVGLIMDIVLNHIGSKHWWMTDLPAKDWINHGGTFAPTNHRRTTIQDPHAAPADREAFTDGWFVDAMPDLNQRNPHLARYLIQNTLWWIEYAGLSGIREDTFGYADTQFLGDWAKAVLDEYPDFAMVGEEWSINPVVVAHWQRGKQNTSGHVPHMPSMMDFPIHIALRSALAQPEGWDSGWVNLYEMLANDFLYPDADALVVFAENHDTSRLFAHLDGDLATVETRHGVPGHGARHAAVLLRLRSAAAWPKGTQRRPVARRHARRLVRRSRGRLHRQRIERRAARRAGLHPCAVRLAQAHPAAALRQAHPLRPGRTACTCTSATMAPNR